MARDTAQQSWCLAVLLEVSASSRPFTVSTKALLGCCVRVVCPFHGLKKTLGFFFNEN